MRHLQPLLTGCLFVTLTTLAGGQTATEESARRLPYRPARVDLPLTPYNLDRTLADLAWAVRVPTGYESPEEETWQPSPVESHVGIDGRTVAEVLNEIVARQPRYAWTVDDGVIHLRPRSAVDDATNMLNRTIDAFVVERATLSEALREVRFTLDPLRRGGGVVGSMLGPSSLALRTFDVRVRSSTLLGVLDDIVKAHGAASWSVTYTSANGARRDRITFHTFDGWAITW